MSTDNKDLTPKNAPKKSKKNLIILIILLVFCSVAGFLFFEKSPEKKNEIVEVSSIEDNLEVDEVTEDSTSAVESLIKKDSIELPPVKKLKLSESKVNPFTSVSISLSSLLKTWRRDFL